MNNLNLALRVKELRNQKDMYIRIQDLKLLDLSEDKIYDIMKNTGTSKKIINNFNAINYYFKN